MNTISHGLVSAVALAKRDAPIRNTAIFIGAMLPDAWIFGFYGWSRFVEGESSERVWSVLYWQEPWQTIGAIFNSAPLFATIVILGLLLHSKLFVVLGAAALLHIAFDFPVHASDAHKHFWPLTDWRFHSPLSYWDHNHHGQLVSALEVIGGLILIAVLWLRFAAPWVKGLLILAALGYIAVPAYFLWSLG